MRLRAAVYDLIEDEDQATPASRLVRQGLVLLIVLSVLASMLETVASLRLAYGALFAAVEAACVVAFTLEYLARLWACVEDRAGRYEHPWRGRLRYVLTPLALIDLLAIAPFYLALLYPVDLLFLRVLRLLRLLKITRYSPALAILELVVVNERRSLLSALLVILVALVLSAGLMHLVEGGAQPEQFGSIPVSLWWAVITLTTVGYGDVTPVTALGRLVAGLTAITGFVMLALPTAILGAGFVRELQKQDFVAKVSMITRVPLFQALAPAQLAEITGLLAPRTLPPRFTMVRRGEHPGAMYFIDQGQVVLRFPERRIRLGPGEFFGEVALLEGRPRAATVITLTACHLLELSAGDFHRLMAHEPGLRDAILAAAERRVDGDRA